MLVIGLSAVGHLVAEWSANNLMAVLLVALCYGYYLLSRRLPGLSMALVLLGIYASVQLIINRIDLTTHHLSLCGVYHIAMAIIVVGMFLSPIRFRPLSWTLGAVALLISGSEEGLICLGLFVVIALIKRDWTKSALVPIGLCLVVMAIYAPVGYFQSVYTRLNSERFALNGTLDERMENITHERWLSYVETFTEANWVLGEGWAWNSVGSAEADLYDDIELWQTAHNVPIRITGHIGIFAGLAWFLIFIYAWLKSWRSKWLYVWTCILFVAMIDHFLWTYIVVLPFILLGLQKKEEYHDAFNNCANL